MKLHSKISALGAMVVLATAFASADSVTLGSWGNSNPGVGNTAVTYTGFNAGLGEGFTTNTLSSGTFNISSDGSTVWSAPTGTSSWVSYDPNSGPTGGEGPGTYDPNGTYTYASTFTLAGNTGFTGSLTVMADDTVDVWLNGHELVADGVVGSDAHCSDNVPNCLKPWTFNLDAGGFLQNGVNTLTFNVEQSGSYYQGLDFSGIATSEISTVTPEPSTLLLLGTGLIGSAGALFRRKRA